MNTTATQSQKSFNPTETMIQAARALFVAMAQLTLVRPIVLKYQTEILAAGKWPIRPDFAKDCESGPVLDPSFSYLMSDEDFGEFYARCKQARDAAGLLVEKDDHCPLCVAEHDVVLRERDLISALQPVTKIGPDDACALDMASYREFVKLTLQLMAPFVGDADEILGGRRPLAFVVSEGHTVGVKEYKSSERESQVISAAVTDFAHLVRASGSFLQLKHLTFADLATLIEKNYSVEHKRTADAVSVLRRVHYRNAIHSAASPAEANLARRLWLETLKVGDMVEVTYSRAPEDIVLMRVEKKTGDGWLRLLPNGCDDTTENAILVCAVNGWTKPYAIPIQPPGTTALRPG